MAAAIAALIHVIAFGFGHVLGTSSYWDLPEEDIRAYLVGYRYFLAEPWHWPPFLLHSINEPFTKSLAYTDSIPLFAALNKLVATIVPPFHAFTVRAYIGEWTALVYVLQGVASVACLRALGRKSLGDCVITTIFFVALGPFVFRYAHASLSAHFLVLTALYLYIRTVREPARRSQTFGWFVTLLFAVPLINPYHAAVCFGVFVAAVLSARRSTTALVFLPLGTAALLLSAAFVGFFSKEATTPMWGFSISGANLMSPFTPVRSGIVGSGLPIVDVNAAPCAYEGYAFIGLGGLVLLALALTDGRRLFRSILGHPFLLVLVACCSLFSLSNDIYLGSRLLVHIEIPSSLHWITDQFRAPGRFVWFPLYAAMVVLVHHGLGRFRSGIALALMPLLATIQLVDTTGDWGFVRAFNQKSYVHALDVDVWRTMIQSHARLEVHAPYDCRPPGSPPYDVVSLETEYIASELAKPINGVYSNRPARDCNLEARFRSELVARPDTLYVLVPYYRALAPRLELTGASCVDFLEARVCSTKHDVVQLARRASATAPPQGYPVPPGVRVGDSVDLGMLAAPSFFVAGWSGPGIGGRGMVTPLATLGFVLDESSASTKLRLDASTDACGRAVTTDLEVTLDQQRVGVVRIEAGFASELRPPFPVGRGEHILQLRKPESGTIAGCDRDVSVVVHSFALRTHER